MEDVDLAVLLHGRQVAGWGLDYWGAYLLKAESFGFLFLVFPVSYSYAVYYASVI